MECSAWTDSLEMQRILVAVVKLLLAAAAASAHVSGQLGES